MRRSRLGVVLPANNTVLEPQAYATVPADVTVHFARMSIGSTANSAAAVAAMEANAMTAVDQLLEAGVEVLAYACVSTSLVLGREWERRFVAGVHDLRDGLEVETAAGCVARALKHQLARRIGLVTPYPPELARLAPGYLATHGLEVIEQRDLPTFDVREVGEREPDEVLGLLLDLADADVDAIAVLATDLQVPPPERFGWPTEAPPVIATNTALLAWGVGAVHVA